MGSGWVWWSRGDLCTLRDYLVARYHSLQQVSTSHVFKGIVKLNSNNSPFKEHFKPLNKNYEQSCNLLFQKDREEIDRIWHG